MRKLISFVPNGLTCGNLLCGCLAIIRTMEGDLLWAAYLIGIAVVFDFLDGFAARLLKASSPIGKDLDSLADLVTFGVVPALMMFKLIDISYIVAFTKTITSGSQGSWWASYRQDNLIKYSGLVIALFSALRLAKFNNDTRQTDSFIGLPTPANALFIAGFPLMFHQLGFDFSDVNELLEKGETYSDTRNITGMLCIYIVSSPLLLALTSLLLSLLLVAEIPLIALKFKNFSWADNKIRFILVGISLLLVICFQLMALPLVIAFYLLLSTVNNKFLKTKQ